MAIHFELDGGYLVFRLPVVVDEGQFNQAKDEGRKIPLKLISQGADGELVGAAKATQQELEQVNAVIQRMETELANLKPGEGIDGLVKQRRAQAEKKEEIQAAYDVRAALQRQSGIALGDLAASIGGKVNQVTLPCPDDVGAVLAQIESIATTNADVLVKHAGTMAGFYAARQFLNAQSVAASIIALPSVGAD